MFLGYELKSVWLERLANKKHSSLMGLFVSYEKNKFEPGTVFTKLHFLDNLRISPIS